MKTFEDTASCVIDMETGKRVSKWYSRFGDALNMEQKMNYRFGGQVVTARYRATQFDVYMYSNDKS